MMVTRFRTPSDEGRPYAALLDHHWRPGGRDVLDVPADFSTADVVTAADQVLASPADQLDLAVAGRLIGVLTLSSKLTARITHIGDVRGGREVVRRHAPQDLVRLQPIRLVCGDCATVVHLAGRPPSLGRCPAGHPLAS